MARQSPRAMLTKLLKAWSADTSSKWRPDNPALGQCSVTALVLHDIYGGDILKTYVRGAWHFYNRIDGERYDLTVSQFAEPIVYDDIISNRSEALNDTSPEQYAALRGHLCSE
ncbi:MAG TPA: hypothetical protein VHM01_05450 [Alphaproteobacteria bacterium]|nr:hypothetical protein [Alphaproteobacteria bacterium]